jgi:hypothetical protein
MRPLERPIGLPSWHARAASRRKSGAAPTPAVQPELARIAFNSLGNPRLLIAGPVEAGRQRFLLVSLMARSDQLVLPAYESSAAWFDAIWHNDFESRTATPPAYWSGRLTPAQLAAWSRAPPASPR